VGKGWAALPGAIFILFQASQRDLKAPAKNQPRRNEEREEGTERNLRALRFFVVDFHYFGAPT